MKNKYSWVLGAALSLMLLVYGFQNHRPGEIIKRGAYSGMVYIPGGTFVMGQSEQDFPTAQSQSRQVTISPFYMDATEITNAQYKEFVHWVRDSILVKNYLQ